MVTALLYCELTPQLNGPPDLVQVQKHLIRKIPTISHCDSDSASGTQVIYVNNGGVSLLESLATIEQGFQGLQKRVEGLETRNDELEKKNDALEKKNDVLEQEVRVLRPLRVTAINIRKRLFAVCCREENRNVIGNRWVIISGNMSAHNSDVETDVCLFNNGLQRTILRPLNGFTE